MNIAPLQAETASTRAAPPLDRLANIRAETASMESRDLLEFVLKRAFWKETAIVSSFAAESVVLLHQVAEIDPTTPVLFLNTGKLFGETLRYRDRLQEVLGLTDIRAIGPHPGNRKELDEAGDLWSREPDACCHFRKVVPLSRAVVGFSAIVTGRKRFQTTMRASMERVELADGRFRFNPLFDWTLSDLTRYIEKKELPQHPLAMEGYSSIGCLPCTRRLEPGEKYRDGRWAGLNKEECGIHAGIDGEGI